MVQSYVEQQALERERLAQIAAQQEQRRAELAAHQEREEAFRQARAAKQQEREAWMQQVEEMRERVARGEVVPPAMNISTPRALLTNHYREQDEQRRASEKEQRQRDREQPSKFTQSMRYPAGSKFARAMKDRIINRDDYE